MEGLVVFGGAGYIGSNLAISLRDQYRIIVIDKAPKPEWFDIIMPPTSEYHVCDLTITPYSMASSVNAKYAIILAALKDVVEGEAMPFTYARDNLAITINCLEYCKIWGIDNVLLASSCAVYHTTTSCLTPKHCFNEDDMKGGELPLGVYGSTKLISEHILTVLNGTKKNKRNVILRYANPIGSVAEHPIFPVAGVMSVLAARPSKFIQRGNGERDYLNIRDLVEMHRFLLNNWEEKIHDDAPPTVLNIGSGNTTTTSDLVHQFCLEVARQGVQFPLEIEVVEKPTFEAMRGCTDMTRFKVLFDGWSPKHSVRETIEDYVRRFPVTI